VTLIEVAILTPFVELSDGPLARVANYHGCLGLLFSLVAIVVVAPCDVRSPALPNSRRLAVRWSWMVANPVLYGCIFWFSTMGAG
jgi:hypothetical protein